MRNKGVSPDISPQNGAGTLLTLIIVSSPAGVRQKAPEHALTTWRGGLTGLPPLWGVTTQMTLTRYHVVDNGNSAGSDTTRSTLC